MRNVHPGVLHEHRISCKKASTGRCYVIFTYYPHGLNKHLSQIIIVPCKAPADHSWCAVWPLNNAYVWAPQPPDLQRSATRRRRKHHSIGSMQSHTLNTAMAWLWSNVRWRRIFVHALCTYLSPSAACDAPRSLLLLINATFNPPCSAEHTRLHTETGQCDADISRALTCNVRL